MFCLNTCVATAEGRLAGSQKGIPTVGLYTGAGGLKSETQVSLFGGAADHPYDPCYHRTCDTIENINRDVWCTAAQF